MIGLAVAAFALVVLWNVAWPEKWAGLVLAVLAAAALIPAWAHLYLLRHPPTLRAADDVVTIHAWPLLREPLILTGEEVRRIDEWDHARDAGVNVALLAAPFVRPNVVVRLNHPRRVPAGRLVPTLLRWTGVPIGSLARAPSRKRHYNGFGLYVHSKGEQPEDWPYPIQ